MKKGLIMNEKSNEEYQLPEWLVPGVMAQDKNGEQFKVRSIIHIGEYVALDYEGHYYVVEDNLEPVKEVTPVEDILPYLIDFVSAYQRWFDQTKNFCISFDQALKNTKTNVPVTEQKNRLLNLIKHCKEIPTCDVKDPMVIFHYALFETSFNWANGEISPKKENTVSYELYVRHANDLIDVKNDWDFDHFIRICNLRVLLCESLDDDGNPVYTEEFYMPNARTVISRELWEDYAGAAFKDYVKSLFPDPAVAHLPDHPDYSTRLVHGVEVPIKVKFDLVIPTV